MELRRRSLRVFVVFFAQFLLLFIYAAELFHWLMVPLIQVLPTESSLIATQLTSSVLTPLSLAAHAAALGTAPYALLEIWLFAAPGLYRRERRGLGWVILASLLLFFLGFFFCFYVVLPLMLAFFAAALPEGVRLMPDMAFAVEFMTRMLLLFGLCFQVPLVCLFLVHIEWLDIRALKIFRPYAIVSAFTLGMLLTPPDVLSQVMLAVPLCLLYELGILAAFFVAKRRR